MMTATTPVRRSYKDYLHARPGFPLPDMTGAAQAISTGTAKTLQAAEGEACERGPQRGCALTHSDHEVFQ